jgi:hypothetical protein
VSLNVAGNLTTTAGGITLRHSTPVGSPTATLADGGNLSLMVGGNLTTAPGAGLTLDIINTSGSSVLNGANIFASIGGDLQIGQRSPSAVTTTVMAQQGPEVI